MTFDRTEMRAGEKGNVLFYILIAIALLAAITFVVSGDGGGDTIVSQKSYQALETVEAQAQAIRSAIQECVLTYPAGGGDIDGDGDVDTEDNPNRPYPLLDLGGANIQAGTGTLDKVMCPGHPSQQAVWSGSVGRFVPDPPAGFSGWTYTNMADSGGPGTSKGVWIQTTGSAEAWNVNALNRMISKYSSCEMALDADPDGDTTTCGAYCLTIWIINKSGGGC